MIVTKVTTDTKRATGIQDILKDIVVNVKPTTGLPDMFKSLADVIPPATTKVTVDRALMAALRSAMTPVKPFDDATDQLDKLTISAAVTEPDNIQLAPVFSTSPNLVVLNRRINRIARRISLLILLIELAGIAYAVGPTQYKALVDILGIPLGIIGTLSYFEFRSTK